MPLQWLKAAVSLFCSTEAGTKHGVCSTAAASWWLLTAGLYCRQMSMVPLQWPKAAVSLVCSTEAETKHGVSSTAATSWWLVTAGWLANVVLLQACIAGKCQ